MKYFHFIPAACIFLFCQCGRQDSHFLSDTKYIPVFSEDSCQYIDHGDNLHFTGTYSDASLFYDNMALICNQSDKKWGYIDDSGELQYPAVYTRATIFNENRAWVVRPDEAPCAIDTKGRLQLTLTRASKVMIFCEGMAAFAQKEKKGERWGFIDKSGTPVIKPLYKDVKPFSSGLAAVKNEQNLWGYIDSKGIERIPAQFSSAESFSKEGHAVVRSAKSGLFQVIDTKGDTLWTIECDALISDGNTFRIKKDKKWGWCDNKGNIFIEPRFEDSESFGNTDLAPVKIRGKWGYINRKGEWKIKRQFSKAFPFFDGLAVVQTGTVYGLIDPDGHFQINPQYDRISEDYIHQSIGKGSVFTLVESDHARYK